MAALERNADSDELAAGLRHLASADPILRDLIARAGPLALSRDPRLFRTLVSAIVSQQLSSAGAAAILRRVEALFPEAMTPAGLVAMDDAMLRSTGLSGAKVTAVRDLATRVEDGRLDLAGLEHLGDEAIVQELIAVRGIGRWTAEMFLIFSLNRLDVLPVDDYGIRSAVKRVYGLPAVPTKRELVAVATDWHPYCSIASLILWQAIDNRPKR